MSWKCIIIFVSGQGVVVQVAAVVPTHQGKIDKVKLGSVFELSWFGCFPTKKNHLKPKTFF